MAVIVEPTLEMAVVALLVVLLAAPVVTGVLLVLLTVAGWVVFAGMTWAVDMSVAVDVDLAVDMPLVVEVAVVEPLLAPVGRAVVGVVAAAAVVAAVVPTLLVLNTVLSCLEVGSTAVWPVLPVVLADVRWIPVGVVVALQSTSTAHP